MGLGVLLVVAILNNIVIERIKDFMIRIFFNKIYNKLSPNIQNKLKLVGNVLFLLFLIFILLFFGFVFGDTFLKMFGGLSYG